MKKKNPFVRVKQYLFEDKNDNLSCWVDEEDLPKFKEQFSDIFEEEPDFQKAEREISGYEYNKWLTNNLYIEDEGHSVDEECPCCGHVLVEALGVLGSRYCSNYEEECEYENDIWKEHERKEMEEWKRVKDGKSDPKFREVGETLEQFIVKHGFGEEKIMKGILCPKCKEHTGAPSDFYRTKNGAFIEYKHGDCKNVPATIRPLGQFLEDLMGVF